MLKSFGCSLLFLLAFCSLASGTELPEAPLHLSEVDHLVSAGDRYVLLGQYDLAISSYRQAFSLDPDRADIAEKILDLSITVGDRHTASLYLDRASVRPSSDTRRAKLYSYRDYLHLNRSHGLDLTVAGLYSSNIRFHTDVDEIYIAGLPFRLTTAPEEGFGANAMLRKFGTFGSANTSYDLMASYTNYDTSETEDMWLRAAFDRQVEFPSFTARAGVNFLHRWYDGASYVFGGGLRGEIETSRYGMITLDYMLSLYHSDLSDFSAHKPVIVYRYPVLPNLLIGAGAHYASARADINSYAGGFALLRYVEQFGQVKFDTEARLTQDFYRAALPLFDDKRSDLTLDFAASVSHQAFRWRNVVPRLHYYYYNSTSNLALYSYDAHVVSLSVTFAL
jgi:tetratricopeptide (TPR) repeat protein